MSPLSSIQWPQKFDRVSRQDDGEGKMVVDHDRVMVQVDCTTVREEREKCKNRETFADDGISSSAGRSVTHRDFFWGWCVDVDFGFLVGH